MTSLIIVIALQLGSANNTRTQWLPVVKSAADHYDLDWRLLDALIWQESNWNPNAISQAGAQGLAQIMPGTARELKVIDAFDPGQNIWGAAWYLRRMHNRFQDWRLTLASYNAGPGRVGRCKCVPSIRETENYVRNIMSKWKPEE